MAGQTPPRADVREPFRQRLAAGGLVLDGAVGTELERRGVIATLPLWSAAALLEAPEVVEAIHREYVAAGAEILVADTFRTNVRTLRAAGRVDEGPRLNALAVELARRAAEAADAGGSGAVRGGDARGRVSLAGSARVFVAASVAPVEDCYRPERVPPDGALQAEHERMMDWLAAAGPDLVWIETMNTAREARIAAESAAARGLPCVVSWVVAESGDLLGGDRLEDAVAAVEELEPLALGLNCIPPRGMSAILPWLCAAARRPVAAYAHIGNARPIPGWSTAQAAVGPAEYAEYAREWRAAGAAIVGGCCGTTPAHIRAVCAAVERG